MESVESADKALAEKQNKQKLAADTKVAVEKALEEAKATVKKNDRRTRNRRSS